MSQSVGASGWGSRLGFILASAGSAVGLGAIWKFPYMAGTNGGSVFMLPYILFTFTVGVALLIAEFAMGRAGRRGPVGSLNDVCGKPWGIFGGIGVLTVFLILSFYSCVGGWCLKYTIDAITGVGIIKDPALLGDHFGGFVSDGAVAYGYLLAFLLLTTVVVLRGIEAGIEKLSKILMPSLFILMIILIIRGVTLPGGWEGVKYLFLPRWEDFNGAALFNAMGFCFFSLSLGAGILVTYGSYLSDKTCIPSSSMWVAVLAIQAALLAGLMVMPAVFAFGLEPNAGPGLVFITVPMIFSSIPFGDVFAALFYICLFVAALTSSVSLLEVVTAFLQNEWHLSRRTAVIGCWISLFFLGAVSALSFGTWSGFTIAGRNFFDFLDFVCTNFFMPAGGLAVALLAGWRAWPVIREEIVAVRHYSEGTVKLIHFMLSYLSPILVLVAFYQGLFG